MFGLLPTAQAATNDISALLQKGLFEEEGNHNLAEAMRAYQAVIGQMDEARGLAATALFRLGECYRKQGKTNEAVAQYERLVRDFSDQSTLVTLSWQNLAGSGSGVSAPGAAVPSTAAAEAERVQLENLIAHLKSLPERKLVPAIQQSVPNPLLGSLLRKKAEQEQSLALLSQQYGTEHNEVRGAKAVLETIDKQIHAQAEAILEGLETKRNMAAKQASELQNVRSSLTTSARSNAARLEQEHLLEEEIRLVEKQLAHQQKQVDTGGLAPGGLLPAQRELLKLKRQLAALATEQALAPSQGEELRGSTPSSEAEEVKHIQEMIRNSPDLINARDENGLRPLHKAASKGQVQVAQFLLESGADPNLGGGAAQNISGWKPLHFAAGNGHKAMVDLLMKYKADVNGRANRGDTPLHVAAELGFRAVAELLLARGALVDARNEIGRTPLHKAADAGQLALVDLLLANKADVNAKDSGPVANPELSPNENTRGATPLINAILRRHGEVVKLLLANKADVNFESEAIISTRSQRQFPLHFAMLMGSEEIARLLLDHGADPNAQPSYPNSSVRGLTPLLLAVGSGFVAGTFPANKDFIQLLLARGPDPNIADSRGFTCLHHAVEKHSSELAELLIANQADVNRRDSEGRTPLHVAASAESKELTAVLLDHNANPNLADQAGNTPLHFAVGRNQREVIELLLAKAADVNQTNLQGRTPLMLLTRSTVQTPGGVPPRPISVVPGQGYPGAAVPSAAASGDIASLLRAHGAVEELPDFSSIRITRKGAVPSSIVFKSGTNSLNRFRLLEVIGITFAQSLESTSSGRRASTSFTDRLQNLNSGSISFSSWSFPDFSTVKIHRPEKGKPAAEADFTVNLLTATNGLACARDMWLQFGDIVDLPEREHVLAEQPIGLTDGQTSDLRKCLARKVSFSVKGQKSEVTLMGLQGDTYLSQALKLPEVQSILRSSSDLSRVRVNRTDPEISKARDYTLDETPFVYGQKPLADDLWLREGDVIEVPEKP